MVQRVTTPYILRAMHAQRMCIASYMLWLGLLDQKRLIADSSNQRWMIAQGI